MRIGIIGVGMIGGVLARRLVAAGHRVRVANSRGAEGVRAFADEVGAEAADVRGAVRDVDLIIVSIPFPAVADLPKDLLRDVPPEVPVIDTGNYYPGMRDPQIAEIDAGLPESVWVARQLGRPVIKAFNNILFMSLAGNGRPAGAPDRHAIAVAGDDAAAKRMAMDLVDELGFDPVDAGALEDSWRQQPLTPAYCCDYDAATTQKGLAAAVRGEAPQLWGRFFERIKALGPTPALADIVALNRSLHPLA